MIIIVIIHNYRFSSFSPFSSFSSFSRQPFVFLNIAKNIYQQIESLYMLSYEIFERFSDGVKGKFGWVMKFWEKKL